MNDPANRNEIDLSVSEAFNVLDHYRVQDIEIDFTGSPPSTSGVEKVAPLPGATADVGVQVLPLGPGPQQRPRRTAQLVGGLAAAGVALVVLFSQLGGGPSETIVAATDPASDDTVTSTEATNTGEPIPDDPIVVRAGPTDDIADDTTTTAVPESTTTTVATDAPDDPPAAPEVGEAQEATSSTATTVAAEPPIDGEAPLPDPTTTEAAPETTTTEAPADTVAPQADGVVSGLVTEVFTDCVSHMVLDDDGIISEAPVTCDGGSFVVIDGIKIVTAGGYTPTGYFDFHPHGMFVGETASFNTAIDPESGLHTLNCEGCGPA